MPTMTLSNDLKGHYALLGLPPGASPAEVKAAYRRLVKNVHPDRNRSAEAGLEFSRISEAYAALKEVIAEEGAAPSASPRFASDDEPFPDQPYACDGCGRVTAQPRFAAFHRVKSVLVWSFRASELGIFCRDCADHAAARASTATWALGWWSVPGLVLAPLALLRNLLGGTMPASLNARLLIRQANAFLSLGEIDIARSLSIQAVDFVRTPAQRQQVRDLLEATKSSSRRLKERWKPGGTVFLAQLLPLLALPLVGLVFWAILRNPWGPELVGRAEIAVPVAIGEIRHVAIEEMKVRDADAEGAPVLAILERFATVEVVGEGRDTAWFKVRTPAGVVGFVRGHGLYAGSGERLKREWCAENKGTPPASGEALLRRASGDQRLLVHNDGKLDGVLKLKTLAGNTVVSFFVPATYHIGLSGVPDGTYRMEFATGRSYSRACGLFTEAMNTAVLPFTLTLKPLTPGKSRPLGLIPEISLTPSATDPNKPLPLAPERFLADE